MSSGGAPLRHYLADVAELLTYLGTIWTRENSALCLYRGPSSRRYGKREEAGPPFLSQIYFGARSLNLLPFLFKRRPHQRCVSMLHTDTCACAPCHVFGLLFAYEKFGVIFKPTSLLSPGSDRSTGNGLACFHVCNWHQKSRAHPLVYPEACDGEKESVVSLWEGYCEDRV